MAIVARASRPRSILAACVACVLVACSPTPSGRPSDGASPGATSLGTQAAGPPPCPAEHPAPPALPWWQSAVFYEVFVRSFADSNGDGIGDLDGLTAHLDDLNDGNPNAGTDLGVTALWLMPVAQSPSYHGYDVTNYTKVEPDYGDSAAFQRLIAAAHQHGIKVVVDFEANHTSNQHPWFRDALANGPHHDWYIWSKDDPGWPNPIGAGDPWRPSDGGYYYGLFTDAMPDLNLRNPAVTAELDRVAAFWMDTMGVDGFRIDAARHLIEDGPDAQLNTPETRAWLAAFRDDVHADRSDALVVGEVNDAEKTSASYIADGSLDMSFDFEIGPAILNAAAHGDAGSLLYVEDGLQRAYPDGGAGTFLSNHDEPRAMTQLRGDVGAAKAAAGTLLTAPGTPFIYYGEELGMTGDKPDERIRTPYPWTATGPGYGFTTGAPWELVGDGAATANLETERADPGSLLNAYRDLVRLRVAQPSLSVAPFLAVDASQPHVAASLRVLGETRLLVIQNLAGEPASDVVLTLDAGPLCGTLGSVTQLAPVDKGAAPAGAAAITPPVVGAGGGFEGYVPLHELAPWSTTVLQLGP